MPEPTDIYHWRQLGDRITTSGQPGAAMDAVSTQPVHVDCIANFEVSAFLFRWQRDVLGFEDKSARADGFGVQPGGVWADFIGDGASVALEHRPPKSAA